MTTTVIDNNRNSLLMSFSSLQPRHPILKEGILSRLSSPRIYGNGVFLELFHFFQIAKRRVRFDEVHKADYDYFVSPEMPDFLRKAIIDIFLSTNNRLDRTYKFKATSIPHLTSKLNYQMYCIGNRIMKKCNIGFRDRFGTIFTINLEIDEYGDLELINHGYEALSNKTSDLSKFKANIFYRKQRIGMSYNSGYVSEDFPIISVAHAYLQALSNLKISDVLHIPDEYILPESFCALYGFGILPDETQIKI